MTPNPVCLFFLGSSFSAPCWQQIKSRERGQEPHSSLTSPASGTALCGQSLRSHIIQQRCELMCWCAEMLSQPPEVLDRSRQSVPARENIHGAESHWDYTSCCSFSSPPLPCVVIGVTCEGVGLLS